MVDEALTGGKVSQRELGELSTMFRGSTQSLDWTAGAALVSLGTIAHAEQDDVRAQPLLEQSLAIFRSLGDRAFTAWCLSVLGRVATAQRETRRAEMCFTEALSLFRMLSQRDGMVNALEGLAGLGAACGDARRAARLFGAAEGVRTDIHRPLAPCDRPEYERAVTAARAHLDSATFTTAWAEGRAMTLEQAIAYALEETATVS